MFDFPRPLFAPEYIYCCGASTQFVIIERLENFEFNLKFRKLPWPLTWRNSEMFYREKKNNVLAASVHGEKKIARFCCTISGERGHDPLKILPN